MRSRLIAGPLRGGKRYYSVPRSPSRYPTREPARAMAESRRIAPGLASRPTPLRCTPRTRIARRLGGRRSVPAISEIGRSCSAGTSTGKPTYAGFRSGDCGFSSLGIGHRRRDLERERLYYPRVRQSQSTVSYFLNAFLRLRGRSKTLMLARFNPKRPRRCSPKLGSRRSGSSCSTAAPWTRNTSGICGTSSDWRATAA